MNIRLGIIGGGQLALYLCAAAQKLGIEVTIMTEPGDSPALALADNAYCDEVGSVANLEKFLAACDVVTFDKEAIPDQTLAHLEDSEQRGQIMVHPRASILSMIKDKGLQKTWLIEQNLPTLPFCIMSEKPVALERLREQFGGALVQKARRGGYDGRGVQILKLSSEQQDLWPVPSIIEPYLPNCREISVLTVRAQSGEQQTYPPVEMVFDTQINTVESVAIPAAITPQQSEEATALARRAVDSLAGVGVFAIEMFITPEGEILINEISPRVHNSGHVTMDACNVSQFEHHVRAVLGLPLQTINIVSPASMLNILYHQDIQESCPDQPTTVQLPELNAIVYWYGKTPGQPGRKMGHINSTGSNAGEAQVQAQAALRVQIRRKGGQAA
ncbi:MAG: 5-(carboxyamino)imidazole ribonucleotide synthase [Bacteroidia bacterium]|jgi:5-(carboxyamino)imidazole ribonucleotide synthase